MANLMTITMPQVNVNDSGASMKGWKVQVGAFVAAGEVLAVMETSKATEELTAPCAGYFFPLVSGHGDYKTGTELAVVSDDADYKPAVSAQAMTNSEDSGNVLLTKKARELVEKFGIALSELPQGVLLKEKDVLAVIESKKAPEPEISFDRIAKYIEDFCASGKSLSNAILIAGAGTTAKIVIDTIRQLPEYEIFGIVDYNYTEGQEISVLGIPVIGNDSNQVLTFLYEHGVTKVCNSVASLTNLRAREAVYQRLKAVGFEMPCIVHPTAFVEANAVLEEGVFAHAHAYVGSEAHIGHNTFINTNAIVSHECNIGCSVFCAPNATIAGIVSIGDCTLVGMCATILSRVKIGSDVVILNGARVFNNIEDKTHVQ